MLPLKGKGLTNSYSFCQFGGYNDGCLPILPLHLAKNKVSCLPHKSCKIKPKLQHVVGYKM